MFAAFQIEKQSLLSFRLLADASFENYTAVKVFVGEVLFVVVKSISIKIYPECGMG